MNAVDKELADLRRLATRNLPTSPVSGQWFTAADRAPDDWYRCGICGSNGSLVQDHCHATGLLRGMLCPSCNQWEGKSTSPALEAWRLTAPYLTVGARVIHGREGYRHSTHAELLTLPLEVLFGRHAHCEHLVGLANAERIEAAFGHLFAIEATA